MADTYGYSYETSKTARRWTDRTRVVKGITIHHWGGTGSSFDGIVNWFCAPDTSAMTSAHYVAQGTKADGTESRRVACIVDPDKIAWHAGDWQANVDTIGIECRTEARTADYEVVSELVARLWITYGVVPLYPHKHWASTACPGKWDLAKIKTMATAKMAALKAPAPAPAPAPKPTTVTVATSVARTLARGDVTVTATVTPAVAGVVKFDWTRPGDADGWQQFGGDQKPVNGKAAVKSTPGSDIVYRARFYPTDKTYSTDWSPNVAVDVVTWADVIALEQRLAELQP